MHAVRIETAMVYHRARLRENIPNGNSFFFCKRHTFIAQNLQAVVDILESFTLKEGTADFRLFLIVLVRRNIFRLNKVFV